MSSYAIEAEAIDKSYRVGVATLRVLEGIDLQVGEQEFLSIQGESGCGKTTLLNLLCGLESPDNGYVKWGGQSIESNRRDALAKRRSRFLGIVFQSYYLVPEIDVLQNVLMSSRIANGSIGTKDVEKARGLLERVGLGDRGVQMPNTLSGGERQRVAIARALMNDPRVLMADEPTGNLDERTGGRIMDLLQELCSDSRTALVLVTHNLEHAARADRRLTLTKGKLDE